MDMRESYLGKRSLFDSDAASQQKLEDDEGVPAKKKLRTKLIDIFNRPSVAFTAPEDYIKVFLRIKPTEDNSDGQTCLTIDEDENSVVAAAPEQSHTFKSSKRGLGSSSQKFTFSRIFNEHTSQGDFFNATMLDMTKDFISGQNSLVFTYGVTSSGKTYTIQGEPQNAGVLPRCLDVIFNSISGRQISNLMLKPRMFTDVVSLSQAEVASERKIKEKTLKMSVSDDTSVMTLLGSNMESALSDTATSSLSGCGDELLPEVQNRDREELKVDVEDQGKIRYGVWVSFAEIYNEQIFDLLEAMPSSRSARRQALKICDDKTGNPYIKGLKEIHVESADEAYRLLTIGRRNLQTACTRLNHCSSRSHCMFNIKIIRIVDKEDPQFARVSMLSLCDLAGSERHSKTQSTGDRLKEAGNINTSLMTLSRCIETLRYNQQHRDTQRLVPFRDSKLTRLLQNYFNGSGRAVMIVNVSQCASMFDETLQVFKFSAIAKQVKYIVKPPESSMAVKEKKLIPVAHRPSIEWEIKEPPENPILKDAQCKPLPSDDDDNDLTENVDNDDDDDIENCKDVNEMRVLIKTLQLRNERLVEMLEEEIQESSRLEVRVRREVTQAMMKQIVKIETTYSQLLKQTNEEAQEFSDERVRGIMDVYEQRLERIQRKVDEDDEWVSSLLYYQEQMKVEERDARIADFEKRIQELETQIADSKKKCELDTSDNSRLIETLKQELEVASDLNKAKDVKIEECESHISEAVEVYQKNVQEISQLKENKEKLENEMSSVKEQLKECLIVCDNQKQSLKTQEAEWKALEEKLHWQIQNKDSTISSLQDECKELHDEIERLQDQMSEVGDKSRSRSEMEASSYAEQKLNASSSIKDICSLPSTSDSVTQDKKGNIAESISKEKLSVGTCTHNEDSAGLHGELVLLKEEAAKKEDEADKLKETIKELEEKVKYLQHKIDGLVEECAFAKEKYEKSAADAETLQKSLEQLNRDVESAHQCEMRAEEKLKSSCKANQEMEKELESLQKVILELTTKVQDLENQLKDLSVKKEVLNPNSEDVCIAGVDTEQTVASSKKDVPIIILQEDMNQNDDNRNVLKINDFDTAHESLKSERDELKEKNFALLEANDSLRKRIQVLEGQFHGKNIKENEQHVSSKDINITEMVRKIEQKAMQVPESSTSGNQHTGSMNESDDTEVVFKHKVVTVQGSVAGGSVETLNTLTTAASKNSDSSELAMKLKDAELANVALRGKLKREEEDYFKREQALIHGYTAEVEHLKYELAKMKSKTDTTSRTKVQRGKRKATAMDTSTSSALSDSVSEAGAVGDLSQTNTTENILKEKQSSAILSNELLSLQQQLQSLGAAYRKLQTAVIGNETNSFIQNVVLGTTKRGTSAIGVFKSEDNITDSVLEFEIEEYVIKMDEMKTKISQQEEEIKTAKAALEELEKFREQAKQAECELKTSKEDLKKQAEHLKETEAKLADIVKEKMVLDESGKHLREELDLCKDKMSLAEKKCSEIEEALQKTISSKSNIECSLKSAYEKHAAMEEVMKSQKQEYENRITALTQQFSGEGEEKVEKIAKLEQCTEDLKQQLKEKTTELEKIQCLRQEEGAEVSQKLLMLEREKKLAERKAADASERELEWQQKCQGLDHMKQLEQQLHEQLRTAAEAIRKHSQKTHELNQELAGKNAELEQLWKELDSTKENNLKTQNLETKIGELEASLAAEKEERQQAQKSIQEYTDKTTTLKVCLAECEDMLEQQEKIINKQDEELDSIKTKLSSVTAEKVMVDQVVRNKEEETMSLKQLISRLESEIAALKQSTEKACDVEKIHHDELQKTNLDKLALEEKIHTLERENKCLEDKLRSAAQQKDLEDLKEKLDKAEKQKMNLLMENDRMTEKQKILEEEVKKVNLQRVEELEQSRLLEAQLKHFRKEVEEKSTDKSKQMKVNEDLERESKHLHDELIKMKEDVLGKEKELNRLQENLKETTESLQSQEKELRKQERINKRNREEMENWKQERDSCVSKLEQLINKRQKENNQLIQDNGQLKKDNADLVKQVGNITSIKDSVIADLRKINNTLSIQLAQAQGLSPPPKMATPDNSIFSHHTFTEDLDTTGHLEIDATPPIAAKKCRKRQGSSRQAFSPSTSSLSVDSEVTMSPLCKSLKPIEEQNENSPRVRTPSPLKASFHSATSRVAELASEVIASITPLTRSAKKQQEKDSKKKKQKSLLPPFDLSASLAADETQKENDNMMRRSSRLRTRAKHSVI